MNSLTNLNTVIANLRRYHMVIFIVGVVIGLAVAILLLNEVVLKTNSSTTTPTSSQTSSFDQATINRIKQLKTSSDPSTPLDFSQGRVSPFSE